MGVIEESIKDLKAFNAINRQNYVRKLLDFYNGNDIADYIEGYFSGDAFKEIPPYETNFVNRFINKFSRIYTIGATRSAGDRYNALTVTKNARMKHIERMTRLLGTIATHIVWKGDRFEYRPIYYFNPIFGDDPFDPVAVTYPVMGFTEDASITNPERFMYWDSEIWSLRDGNSNVLDEKEHGYGKLPFVFTHREAQTDGFFVEGANSLINANEHINILLTELLLGERYQMFGQPVLKGATLPNKMRVGSDTTLEIPEDADYSVVSPAGDVLNAIEVAKFLIELEAQNNHLWVSWSEQGGEVPSGISLMIKDLERTEDYEDELDVWKIHEQDMYSAEKAIAKAHGISLPDSLGLDFNEPEYPKTVQDQILWDKHRLELNLTNEVDLLVEYNKDLTKEEADAKIKENKSRNKKLSVFEKVREQSKGTSQV